MKHIFTVHSPITFLVAHGVVNKLKLSIEDVIILTNNYKLPIETYHVFPVFSNLKSRFWEKLAKSDAPKFADSYINKIVNGEQFIAYIDLMSYHQRILVTHPQCSGFHFIEEGNSSYRKNDTLLDMTWDKRDYAYRTRSKWKNLLNMMKWAWRGYTPRLLSIPYSFSSYHDFPNTKFYGFSELAFPQIPAVKKEIVNIAKDETLNKLSASISLKDTIIWVDGSNSRYTGLDEKIYHQAIDKGITLLKEKLTSNPVYLKFRPGISDISTQYLYKKLMEEGISFQVLPDHLILECVFINSFNCMVIGNLSSALFYGAIFGHKAYSIYSLFETQPSTIFDQMPGYWQMVNKL